jgi:general secretion pathway protein A
MVLAAAALLVSIGAGWLSHAWLTGTWMPAAPAVLARWLPPDWLSPDRLPPEPAPPEPALAGAPPAAATQEVPRAALADLAEKVPVAPVDLAGVLMDRTSAMRVLLRRWGAELGDVGAADPCDRVATFGLRCEPDQGGWSHLRAFDLPALSAAGR